VTRSGWQRGAGAILLFAALRFLPPPPLAPYRLCGFHWLTGRPCPLCGLTRAVFALAKGRWAEALHWNLLSPLAFVMLFALLSTGPARARLWSWGVAAFAAYGLCRIAVPTL
jgi:hypothetical protein